MVACCISINTELKKYADDISDKIKIKTTRQTSLDTLQISPVLLRVWEELVGGVPQGSLLDFHHMWELCDDCKAETEASRDYSGSTSLKGRAKC